MKRACFEQVINKYRLADAREAVHLALKALLDDASEVEHEPQDEDYDEFSDLESPGGCTAAATLSDAEDRAPWFGDVARQAVPSFRPAHRTTGRYG